jgi:hypothetical protein
MSLPPADVRMALARLNDWGKTMKAFIAGAAALTLALAVAAPASAETSFRAPTAQSFSQSDLQTYGLNADQTQRAVSLQQQGYQVRALSAEEAQAYRAGFTNNQWIVIGIVAGVILIAAVS